jgi:hypothetical protein
VAAETRLRARFGMDQATDSEWAFLQGQLFGWSKHHDPRGEPTDEWWDEQM